MSYRGGGTPPPVVSLRSTTTVAEQVRSAERGNYGTKYLNLVVGYLDRGCEIALVPTWPTDSDWSDVVNVEFRAVNHGQRTARDLVFNLSLPRPADAQSNSVPIIESPRIQR